MEVTGFAGVPMDVEPLVCVCLCTCTCLPCVCICTCSYTDQVAQGNNIHTAAYSGQATGTHDGTHDGIAAAPRS